MSNTTGTAGKLSRPYRSSASDGAARMKTRNPSNSSPTEIATGTSRYTYPPATAAAVGALDR